eukprot:5095708-Amphidinium_carterae.1
MEFSSKSQVHNHSNVLMPLNTGRELAKHQEAQPCNQACPERSRANDLPVAATAGFQTRQG